MVIANVRFSIPLGVTVMLALQLTVGTAEAQRSSSAGVSRPSDSGPSSRVGRVGGTNTRSADTQGTPAAAGPGATLSLPGLPNRGAATPLPAAVLPGRIGTIGSPRSSQLVRPYPPISLAAIESISNYNAAMDLSAPLEGWRYYTPPALKTAPDRAAQERDAFNGYFGLRSAGPKKVAEDQKDEYRRLLASIEKDAADRIATRDARARELFKSATRETAEGRLENLAQVERLAMSVRDMDSTAWIPSLLIAHSALEREQMVLATTSLATALKRHPTMFQEKFDVAGLFGDRSVFEQQARRYIESSTYNKQSVRAMILTAYCAWLLDDQARLRAALQDTITKSPGSLEREEALVFIRAMEAALNNP